MLTTKSNFWKWALPLIALSVALDQFVKAIVLNTPVFHARECLEPGATMRCGKIEMSSLLDWSMIWNYGVSYGLFQSDGIGRWRLEGKEYVVDDGDVIHFRFNV